MIDASYGAYFRIEAEEEVDGSIRKRKRKPTVVGAPSGVDWDVARYVIILNLFRYYFIFIIHATDVVFNFLGTFITMRLCLLLLLWTSFFLGIIVILYI